MKLNEKSKQIIFEIVPIILFALALVIRFAVDIERLQWGLMEVAAILWLVDNLGKYKKGRGICHGSKLSYIQIQNDKSK